MGNNSADAPAQLDYANGVEAIDECIVAAENSVGEGHKTHFGKGLLRTELGCHNISSLAKSCEIIAPLFLVFKFRK